MTSGTGKNTPDADHTWEQVAAASGGLHCVTVCDSEFLREADRNHPAAAGEVVLELVNLRSRQE